MEIEDVKKMTLGPGETLVIKFDADAVPDDDIAESHECLKKIFPKNKVLFIPKEMDVEIVKEVP